MKEAIFLDDERYPSDSMLSEYTTVYIIRSAADFKQFITVCGCPSFITFDHDLGPEEGNTGMECAKFLIDLDLDNNGKVIPQDFTFYVHSMNCVGSANIKLYMAQYLNYRNGGY